MIKQHFRYLLLGFVLIDFTTPYLLALFYPEYNSLTQVISELGSVNSPVYYAFSIASILSGTCLLSGLVGLMDYLKSKTSSLKSLSVSCALASFAIGECLFSGLFSIDSATGYTALIHELASILGSLGMLFFPFLIGLVLYKQTPIFARRFFVIGTLSIICAFLNGYAQYIGLDFAGIYQRLSMTMMYMPIVIFVLTLTPKTKPVFQLSKSVVLAQ